MDDHPAPRGGQNPAYRPARHPRPEETITVIYHLALRKDWEDAVAARAYRRSTLGHSLEDVGFIHCSFPSQVQRIADLVYRGRDDVVLLEIDPARLTAELRVEPVGTDEFPHIYGELPVDAVLRVTPVPVDSDGRLRIDGAI
jgi:uncharacterized protein (DUF952 family)